MSEDKKDFKFEIFENGVSPFKSEDLTEEEAAQREKAYYMQVLSRKVKNLNPDGMWSIPQELLQEVQASYIVANPSGKLPTYKVQRLELQNLIKDKYKGEFETRDLLLESIPSDISLRSWAKKKGWEEAIWAKIRTEGLFTKEKRVEMLESLYNQGKNGNVTAAKIWLTISGDYSDKMDIQSDRSAEVYREINKALRKES